MEIVRLLVLGSGNVGGKNRSGFKSNVYHHLEHIDDIVLNAVTLKVGSLLVEVHLHISTRHLDHTVVNCFIGVLKSLEIGVF